MKNVLYLHGFASSPRGRKVEALRRLLTPRGYRVIAPDLNIPSFQKLDFKAMSKVAFWEAKKHMPAVIVGSSLGAMVALDVARTTPANAHALVLIAPALGFGRRWVERLPDGDSIPFFHHGEGSDIRIHRRFFEKMAALDVEGEPPSVPVVAVMGTDDESVPFEGVRRVWEAWASSGRLLPGSRLVAVPGGDHGLIAHVDLIAGEIVSADARRRQTV